MIIDSSSVRLSCQHALVQTDSSTARLKAWIGNTELAGEGTRSSTGLPDPKNFLGNVFGLAGRIGAQAGNSSNGAFDPSVMVDLTPNTKRANPFKDEESANTLDELKLLLLTKLFEKLTGKKFRMKKLDIGKAMAESCRQGAESVSVKPEALTARSGNGAAAPRVGWGIEADFTESHYESEKTMLSANGLIRTRDGKEIVVSVEMSLSREYLEEKSLSIRMGDAALVDPLVVNFAGNAADLSTDKFSFDLDADGTEELISSLKPGSGFLALDKNGDGVINSGAELFGASTGDGFKELAAYDSDDNGWIDEADPIYKQLKIWTFDGAGNQAISSLAAMDVGAINLAAVNSPFQYKSLEDNSLQGALKSTGIFLGDSGSVGTIQQVDMAV